MAETDVFPLQVDYGLREDWTQYIVRQAAQSGKRFQRLVRPPQRIFSLPFRKRPTDDVEALRDWKRRFEAAFFRFDHKVYINNAGTYLVRSFPVEWLSDTLPNELSGNEAYDFEVQLLEAVGRALPTPNYPDPTTGHPSVFQEETETTKEQGTWTVTPHADARGGQEKQNANTNTTDFILYIYAGYGFRLVSRKGPALGIYEVRLDDTSLGNVDLFAASATAFAAVFTKLDVPLGLHRVKLKATNTKNVSSTGNTIVADALEYLP